MLLAEVREKLLKQVTLTVRSEQMVNGFVNEFRTLLENYKGTATVRLHIKDRGWMW